MSTVERERSQRIAASGGPLRVGCWACEFVGSMELSSGRRPTEAEIHGHTCPGCHQVGGMHEYPTVGTWPSDYAVGECPIESDGAVQVVEAET